MARYWAVAHSNPSEGREAEYNDWYWNEHLKAILAIPGVISGQRFTAAPQQFGNAPQPFKYLAVYEIETDVTEHNPRTWRHAGHLAADVATTHGAVSQPWHANKNSVCRPPGHERYCWMQPRS
jgi:hypothetical protein